MGYEVYRILHEAKQRERMLKRNPRILALFKKRIIVRRLARGEPRQVVG